MDAIFLWFGAMYNALLCVSGLSPEDKIEERIPFDLCHARLYLTISYDDWDDKSAAANTFDISCGGGVSISSLPASTVSVLAISNVVGCWLFPSAWFLSNDPLLSDDMVIEKTIQSWECNLGLEDSPIKEMFWLQYDIWREMKI